MPGFGRIIAPDERDAGFPMTLMLDPLRSEFFPRGIPLGNRHYRSGPILNQSAVVSTGTCVAHGWTSKINAAPIMQKMHLTPYDFYRRIVAIDEWPSNDYEAGAPDHMLQSGTSVRAGAKMTVELGYGVNYLWANSAEDVRSWVLAGFGGVVMGTLWLSDMMRTDSDGFVSFAGSEEGGHCYYINGWNDAVKRNGKKIPAARCQNSWGKEWGQGGRFWMTMDDLEKAVRYAGEACALTEQRVKA